MHNSNQVNNNNNNNNFILNNCVLNLSLNQTSNKTLNKILCPNSFGSIRTEKYNNIQNSNNTSIGNISNNNLNQIFSGNREKDKLNNENFELYLNESFADKIQDDDNNLSYKIEKNNKNKFNIEFNQNNNDMSSSEPIKNITFNSTFKKHSIDSSSDDEKAEEFSLNEIYEKGIEIITEGQENDNDNKNNLYRKNPNFESEEVKSKDRFNFEIDNDVNKFIPFVRFFI